MTLLATNIKGLRIRKKITQDQLARHCEVSSAAISQWESKKNPTTPELNKALKMAKFLGTTLEHLMESENIEIGPETGGELSSRLLTKIFATITQVKFVDNFFNESNLTRKANIFNSLYTLYSGMAIDRTLADKELMQYVGLEEVLPVESKKKKQKAVKKPKKPKKPKKTD